MKPPTPEELETENQEFEPEGMLLVGDSGKILAGFHGDQPRLLGGKKVPAPNPPQSEARQGRGNAAGLWVAACKGGPATYGDFLLAGPISDAFNLGAVSLRLGGRKLHFDAAAGTITNLPQANKLLTREYRAGWQLAG